MDIQHAAERWARTWAQAWPAQDIEAILALQAVDGVHWASMFRPYAGRDGLRVYLAESFAEETAPTKCWFADPVRSAAGASVEYWAHCVLEGQPVTITGVTLLAFDSAGLVAEARDYSHIKDGHHPLPAHIRGSQGSFVPETFMVPLELTTEDMRLTPLAPEHNESDHAAWMSSIDHIRATPGFAGRSWPPAEGMTLESNLADLTRHAEEFANRVAFAYTVLDPASGDVIGCVYLKPPAQPGMDVDVLSWVRADRARLDGPLRLAVRAWLRDAWPFKEISYAL